MSGDGFAVKSTISQMNNVARALQKSQQIAQTENAAAGHLLRGEKRVDRVHQPDEPQKTNVDPDRRHRDDGRGQQDERERDGAETATGAPEPDAASETTPVLRLDTTA